jgi:SAM-dependent methyltransferase
MADFFDLIYFSLLEQFRCHNYVQASTSGFDMNQTFDLGKINRDTYTSLQARRQYARATGYLDDGEQLALNYVAEHSYAPDVLDIGVGGGRTVPLMKRFCGRYTGIDYASELIAICQRRFPKETLIEMDARELTFANKSFDVVAFSNNGIDSVGFSDRMLILEQAYRVLRPCGFFVFSALNQHGKERAVKRGLVGCIKDAIGLPVSLINKRRLRKYNAEHGVYSTRTLSAHFSGLVATLTSVPEQIAQLLQSSFYVEQVISCDGQVINQDYNMCESPYIHYVARKPIPT